MAKSNTTTRSIRKTLVDCLSKASKGELDQADGKNIIGLANQLTQNMAVEVKVMTMKSKMGHQVQKFGDLNIA